MQMINDIYATALTLYNKEHGGHITPTRFNEIAQDVQNEIFRNYFEDENRDKLRKKKHLTTRGYGNLDFNERQRIAIFSVNTPVSQSGGVYPLPADVYFIEDEGVTDSNGNVVDEVEHSKSGYLAKSLGASTTIFPTYTNINNTLTVSPSTITEDISVRYIRKPKAPKWTYQLVGGNELFDPTNTSYQDFELHESEFTNILMRVLSRFGITLREADIVKAAEAMLQKMSVKDNN